jgi:hypothetical protein
MILCGSRGLAQWGCDLVLVRFYATYMSTNQTSWDILVDHGDWFNPTRSNGNCVTNQWRTVGESKL